MMCGFDKRENKGVDLDTGERSLVGDGEAVAHMRRQWFV